MAKINWKNPRTYGTAIFLGVVLVSGLLLLAFRAGGKNALENELLTVNKRLENSRISSDDHLKLLARRTALQNLLKNY